MSLRITPKARPTTNAGARRKTVLRVENLVKIYKKRRVVDGVSFEVGEGEVVGLLGANGAGKTTSFRMTCGLIPADSGRIILNGLDVTGWPMYRRAREGQLGYLPQDRSTFGALTTEDNLYAAMQFLGYSRDAMRKECDRLLKKFELEKVRKTVVGMGGTGGLSGGERRRLEVARALLSRPKILLLDEPFANVDPHSVKEIQDVIRNLSSNGIAVLITDHQVDDTLAITHRSYIIDKGRVLCSGRPLEVLQHPDAVKYYFGDKAKSSLQLIRRQLGLPPEEDDYDRDSRVVSVGRGRAVAENDEPARREIRIQRREPRNDANQAPRSKFQRDDARYDAPERETSAGRASLTLKRRGAETEARRNAPSRDQDSERNRYSSKIPGIFGLKKRRD